MLEAEGGKSGSLPAPRAGFINIREKTAPGFAGTPRAQHAVPLREKGERHAATAAKTRDVISESDLT